MKNRFIKKCSINVINIDSRGKRKMSANKAREILISGNNRFVSGKLALKEVSSKVLLDLYSNGQHPFAAIVTCSDSRV